MIQKFKYNSNMFQIFNYLDMNEIFKSDLNIQI